jgi:hypothetical protein
MGSKYQVVDNKGKVVVRVKDAWSRYRRKKGYSLEMWQGAGMGWITVEGSSPKRREKKQVASDAADILNAIIHKDCDVGRCVRCNRRSILGEGLCVKCWDKNVSEHLEYRPQYRLEGVAV